MAGDIRWRIDEETGLPLGAFAPGVGVTETALEQFKQDVEHQIGIQDVSCSIEWREPWVRGDLCELVLRVEDRASAARISPRDLDAPGCPQRIATALIKGLSGPIYITGKLVDDRPLLPSVVTA